MKYKIQRLNDQGEYDEYESCHDSDALAILTLLGESYTQIDLVSVIDLHKNLAFGDRFTYVICEDDLVGITSHHKIINGLVSREMEFYTLNVKGVIVGVVSPVASD